MRSLQTASTTATCVPPGEPAAQPSCTSLRRSVRALRAAGSTRASSAPYHAPSPAPAETIATTESVPHQLASQTLRSVGDAGASSPLATSSTWSERRPSLSPLARGDQRNPLGQVDPGSERARAERVGLLGAVAGDQEQDARAVGRPLVMLDDARRLGQLARFAQDARLQRVELRASGDGPVGQEGECRAVGRPARPGVLVRAVRHLPHARSVGGGQADAPGGLSVERVETSTTEGHGASVRARADVAGLGDPPEPGLGETPVGGLDLLIQRRPAQVSLHPRRIRRDGGTAAGRPASGSRRRRRAGSARPRGRRSSGSPRS